MGHFLLLSAQVQNWGRTEVDAGQMGNFLLSSAPIQDQGMQKVGTGQRGFMKVRCGANWLFFCYFQPQSKTREVEK